MNHQCTRYGQTTIISTARHTLEASIHPRYVQCIKLLLEFAASPRPRNMVGLTAYDMAVAAQQTECAALLEQVGG